jgi:ankyrin repeat protein
MDSFKRVVGTSILALARFLDAHFYQIAAVFVGLAIFNYFFIKNYDKILLESARKGVVKDVKDALRNEADVNTQQNGDCTPLMLACEGKHEEIAQILIDTGKCKVDVVDSKGRTALSIASAVGIVDTVKLLLRNKGDVKSSDNNGDTPLNVACRK